MQKLPLLSLVAAAGLVACDSNSDRIAGAGTNVTPGTTSQLSGFTTSSGRPAIAAVGDVNADGDADYAVGDADFGSGKGRVVVRSGPDSRVLHDVKPAAGQSAFGAAVAAAGDVDGDGNADVLIGAPGAQPTVRGTAGVLSGKTGNLLRALTGRDVPYRFGATVANIGDVDGDAVADHAIGEQYSGPRGQAGGTVYVFSGKTGQELWAVPVVAPNENGAGPTAMTPAGDIDGDGTGDLLVAVDGPAARVLSGKSGAEIRSHAGNGTAVATLGDIDGDGAADYAIGFPDRNASRGQVQVISARTGAKIYEWNGAAPGDRFGTSIAEVSDRNGDGRAEIAVAAEEDYMRLFSAGGTALGEQRFPADQPLGLAALGDLNGDGKPEYAISVGDTVTVYSGAELALSGDVFEISAATGGTQQLTVRGGEANAGKAYWIFGSATGTRPPLKLGNVDVPLAVDTYTGHTTAPSTGIHVSFVGQLGGNGAATAAFAVPPSVPPGVVGLTLFHAAVIFDDTGNPAMATNAVPVTFIE